MMTTAQLLINMAMFVMMTAQVLINMAKLAVITTESLLNMTWILDLALLVMNKAQCSVNMIVWLAATVLTIMLVAVSTLSSAGGAWRFGDIGNDTPGPVSTAST